MPPPPSSVPPPPPGAGFGGAPTYGMPTGFGGPSKNYAGWFSRVVATLIDGLIGFVFIVPGWIVLFAGPSEIGACTIDGELMLCDQPTGGTWAVAGLLFVVGFIGYLVLYCKKLGKGATWGRQAMGYRILDAQTGQPIGTGRAVGRYFASFLNSIPCHLGNLWPLWDAEKRTFADMIVGTRAIKNNR
ncbi:MAG TPA: RDD family protein [Ilumatobacter sp.]|nr:RDD family protein [Ilumatobacter sp.]